MNYSVLRSKTFWGAVLVGVTKIVGDHSPQSVLEAVGGIVAVWGARDAIAKNGENK